MLKNLNTGDRFVDEIGRVFIVKEVVAEGYVTEFVEQIDYKEGQRPYRLEAEPELEAESEKETKKKATGKQKKAEEKKAEEEK